MSKLYDVTLSATADTPSPGGPGLLTYNAHCTKTPINLPVKENKDDDFFEIVIFFPQFSIVTSYLGTIISVCWIFCANLWEL